MSERGRGPGGERRQQEGPYKPSQIASHRASVNLVRRIPWGCLWSFLFPGQISLRLSLKRSLAVGGTEVVVATRVVRPVASSGDLHFHAADRIHDLFHLRQGGPGSCYARASPKLGDLGQNAEGDLLWRHRAQVQASRILQPSQAIFGLTLPPQILQQGLGPLAACNESNVGGRGVERGRERLFIVVTVAGDDDIGCLIKADFREIQLTENEVGLGEEVRRAFKGNCGRPVDGC